MVDTDQKRVQAIFLSAVEDHAPEQWDGFLDEACRGEPKLRRRVESLLRGHRRPNVLLDQANAAPVPVAVSAVGEGPGSIIGPYKLLEQIGDGGFGVVFMAEQQHPVRRKVALKIVKPGMDTRQVVARFEAERQALALMGHPNIAQVFDGGATDSGRPYFVMELVRGVPITDFCDRNHLSVRERLELFTHVCLAVQHAHQKGIIHRDLKPSNVMVTQHDLTPVVKIIDFGIAKATGQQLTDKTLFTNFAQMIGTPMYMSPEQAQMSGLDVDTRSDVYSLGVLLYELMTGKTPFDRERMRTVAYDEMIRIIREEEPVRPSTRISTLGDACNTALIDRNCTPRKLSQLMRGELDWIVMKALEKDRNRRFESAGAMADDVQRYLDGEVVQACPPTLSYRLRKFVRQNKAALASAALVFAALSAGTAVAVWQAVVATQARNEAQESAAAEKRAKIAVEAKEAEAAAVISFLENRVIAAARPLGQDGGLGHDVPLRRAIEAAVPFVQDGFKDQPLLEARLRMSLGYSFGCLGDPKKSTEQYAAAKQIYAKILGPEHKTTLNCAMHVVICYYEDGRFADACQLGEATLAQMRVTFGPEHLVTLKAMDHLAVGYDGVGKTEDALNLREQALAIRKATLPPDHPHTVHNLHDLGVSYWMLGDFQKALGVQEKVVAIRTARLGPDDRFTLESMNNLGTTYISLRQFSQASEMLEKVLAKRRTHLGSDHPHTLESLHNLASCYRWGGREIDGLPLWQELLHAREVKNGPRHAETVSVVYELARCLCALDRGADAIPVIDDGIERASKLVDNPRLIFDLLLLRMQHFIKLRDVVGCRKNAALWDSLSRKDAIGLYNTACAHAIVACVIRDRDRSAEAEKQANDEADRAMEWLRKAVAAGFRDGAHMAKDADLNVLRKRPDFNKLMAELPAGPK
ncbi:MAG: serine/threonine-protein kinase [Gemmataceae bacterium]|nr:serine/threonine-protein kinase [Gemmataceae bacterium]